MGRRSNFSKEEKLKIVKAYLTTAPALPTLILGDNHIWKRH